MHQCGSKRGVRRVAKMIFIINRKLLKTNIVDTCKDIHYYYYFFFCKLSLLFNINITKQTSNYNELKIVL